MARLDRSFLVRWWVVNDDSLRIELQHIQSGERTVVDSPAEALAWMSRETAGPAARLTNRPVQTETAS